MATFDIWDDMVSMQPSDEVLKEVLEQASATKRPKDHVIVYQAPITPGKSKSVADYIRSRKDADHSDQE